MASCPEGYYGDTSTTPYSCALCNVIGCSQCSGGGVKDCTACSGGMGLLKGQCCELREWAAARVRVVWVRQGLQHARCHVRCWAIRARFTLLRLRLRLMVEAREACVALLAAPPADSSCPTGFYKDGNNDCQLCQTGTWSDGSSCQPCPTGCTACDYGWSGGCTACADNYANTAGDCGARDMRRSEHGAAGKGRPHAGSEGRWAGLGAGDWRVAAVAAALGARLAAGRLAAAVSVGARRGRWHLRRHVLSDASTAWTPPCTLRSADVVPHRPVQRRQRVQHLPRQLQHMQERDQLHLLQQRCRILPLPGRVR